MLVDVECEYVRGVCKSPRLAMHPSCTAGARFPGLPYAWHNPCVFALFPARPYVCGRCMCDYS